MAGPVEPTNRPTTLPTLGDVPPLPADATPEQKDAHWFKYIYAGDKMPQLTFRAVLMGGILGMLMSASNLYTTLTIGWSFGVAITACVMSYVLWSGIAVIAGNIIGRLLGPVIAIGGVAVIWWKGLPVLGGLINVFVGDPALSVTLGYIAAAILSILILSFGALLLFRQTKMSLLENNCMQSTASAAGYSTGSTIATMFGALLLLETGDSALIKTLHVQPIWLVAAFTFLTGAMGVFLAIPMKRQMINHEQLPFPSGIAAAETLKSLYSASKEAVYKAYSLVIGLVCGAIIGVLNTDGDTAEKIGPLGKMFAWFKTNLVNIQLQGQYPENGFFTFQGKQLIDSGFQPSVLLIGAGMITGLRVSLSMLAGSLLLYAYVGPQLLSMDAAALAAEEAAKAAGQVIDHPYVRSIELVGGGTVYHVYRWALWAGTGLMVFASLTSLLMQWKTIARAFTKTRADVGHATPDAAMANIEVPGWWMLVGMLPITIAMVALQYFAFHISWYAGVIAVALAFVLSLVACRATGETDTTPIGAMGKVMQLTFALLHPKQIVPNLAAAGIAANSASSSADLLTDLKSGYLLGANPRKQFIAQFVGLFFGTIAIVPIWYLMVPTKKVMEKFPSPGTQSWYRIAKILTEGIDSLPNSAKYGLLIGCCVGIIMPLTERYLIPAKYRKFFPSAMGLGLSWVVPFASAFSFAIGAVITWIWTKIDKKSADTFNVPIASGLIAGESLIKAIIAMTATAIGLIYGSS